MQDVGRTGGCQCGAIRFVVEQGFGRAAICHCRMCQKAFGNVFAPLVTAFGLRFTRGTPAYFQSSNVARRGFCKDCGTPLIYQAHGAEPEVAIGALDDPSAAPPAIQVNEQHRVSWFPSLGALPLRPIAERPAMDRFLEGVVSRQHPDAD